MSKKEAFHKDILVIKDVAKTCDFISNRLREIVFNELGRKGGIIGISGGIDSSVSLALTVKALGKDNVLGIMLPEKDSSPDSLTLARTLAEKFGVKTLVEEITGALNGFACYRRRDEAIKRIFNEYDPETHKMKIGIKQNPMKSSLPPVFSVTIVDPDGSEKSKLLPANEYLQIVAASNFKQRSRMAMLYYHAEKNYYAVIGTPNKHEVQQGFFVKHGDGGADVIPIAALYKTQVYQLARYLGIPEEIIRRTPTSDTYSAEQTQEEFFFQLPFELLDLIWYGWENGYDAQEVAEALDRSQQEIENVYKNFNRKQATTAYLRKQPIVINSQL
ncbi:MAG: NAD(+) synthase [Bacteroidales bacterium]|nr:NAD(+) synthase [Bacteroidales bacterium]